MGGISHSSTSIVARLDGDDLTVTLTGVAEYYDGRPVSESMEITKGTADLKRALAAFLKEHGDEIIERTYHAAIRAYSAALADASTPTGG